MPSEVRAFLNSRVRSLMALELLLMVRAGSDREWSAAELERELRAATAWTERELAHLASHGLLVETSASPARYRYAGRGTPSDEAVEWLASSYPERRFSIIQILYAAPASPIEQFADAFKLRKERPDG